MGEMQNVYKILDTHNMKRGDHLGVPGIEVWIIFRVQGCGTDSAC